MQIILTPVLQQTLRNRSWGRYYWHCWIFNYHHSRIVGLQVHMRHRD